MLTSCLTNSWWAGDMIPMVFMWRCYAVYNQNVPCESHCLWSIFNPLGGHVDVSVKVFAFYLKLDPVDEVRLVLESWLSPSVHKVYLMIYVYINIYIYIYMHDFCVICLDIVHDCFISQTQSHPCCSVLCCKDIIKIDWYQTTTTKKLNTLRPRQTGRHFADDTHFLESKSSLGSNPQYYIIGSDNGLAPTRRHAFIWTNDG